MLPMQDVIEKYYNNDELLEKTMKKYLNIYYDFDLNDYEEIKIKKYITEKDKIHKVKAYMTRELNSGDGYITNKPGFNKTLVSLDYDIKVYELVFMDYDNLDVEKVIDTVEGFRNFMVKNHVPMDLRENSIKRQMDLLLLNENLPDELKLWVMIQ